MLQLLEWTPERLAFTLREDPQQRLVSEIALARELFTLVQQDAHIGFEPSCQYFYLPLDLVEKVVNCRWLLRHFELNQTQKRATRPSTTKDRTR